MCVLNGINLSYFIQLTWCDLIEWKQEMFGIHRKHQNKTKCTKNYLWVVLIIRRTNTSGRNTYDVIRVLLNLEMRNVSYCASKMNITIWCLEILRLCKNYCDSFIDVLFILCVYIHTDTSRHSRSKHKTFVRSE